MRVMVIVKASSDSEAGIMPKRKVLEDMGKFNEQLVKPGIMLAGDGLKPTLKGKRVRFSGEKRTVIDGPLQRDQGVDRGLLDVASAIHGRSARMGEAVPQSP